MLHATRPRPDCRPSQPDRKPRTDALRACRVPLKPVRRLNLVREVVERLREQILAGSFATTDTLPSEGSLGQSLGVSRTVIREAMRILAAQGLVEVSQGRPPRVKPADATHLSDSIVTFLQRADHSLAHLIEVRRHLEGSIAALAAQRATPDQIAALEATIQELTTVETLDLQIEADMRFHTLLAQATGNPVFGLLLEPLTRLLQWSLKETLGRTGTQRAAECHRKILAAVRSQDSAGARAAMLELVAMAEVDLGIQPMDLHTADQPRPTNARPETRH